MHNKPDKPSKKELEYYSACREINLKTDPAAKVLSSLILDDYSLDEPFIRYYPEVALIETAQDVAQQVITNTAELLNRVDSRFRFAFSDFSSTNIDNYKGNVSKIINSIYRASDLDPLTIHVLRNVNDCLQNMEAAVLFHGMFIHDAPGELHFIFVFDEASYDTFSNLLTNTFELHSIWLHRLPGKADINQKTQEHSMERVNSVTINSRVFTQSGRALMNRAQRQADLFEETEIEYTSLLLAAAEGVESSIALEQCLNLTPERLQYLREDSEGVWKGNRNKNHFLCDSSAVKGIECAMKLASAEGYPDPNYPGLISSFHLIGALSMNEHVLKDFGANRKLLFEETVNKIADWYYHKKVSPSIIENCNALSRTGFKNGSYRKMLGEIYGQQEALNVINEAFCLAEFKIHDKDAHSHCLPTCLLFLGPEGTGKGYLARLISETYKLEMQYINLTLCPDEEALPIKPEVKKHHRSLLVFENIEEAQQSVVNQICNIITSGKCKDQNSGKELDFRCSVVIIIAKSEIDWTLGKDQFSKNKLAVIQKAALESLYKENICNKPLMPLKILDLIDKHQVVLFRKLQTKDLLYVCKKKMMQFGFVIEGSGMRRVTFDPQLPYAIIFSEGGKPKPRTISSAVEMLMSSETRKFMTGFTDDSARYLLTSYDRIHFSIEDVEQMIPEVANLFRSKKKPNILLLASEKTAKSYSSNIDSVNWIPVSNYDALESAIGEDCFDFALLDLWFNINDHKKKKRLVQEFITGTSWESMTLPFSAIATKIFGERYMKNIDNLSAKKPVVMLNPVDSVWESHVQEFFDRPYSYYLEASEELSRMLRGSFSLEYLICEGIFRYDLFMEFLESNYLRGMINAQVTENHNEETEEQWNSLTCCIDELHQKLHREKMAEELYNSGKVLIFNSVWELNEDNNLVDIRFKNLRLVDKPVF